jgi:hypothetical protein
MTKLVVRLLDTSGRMLGWVIHQAQIRGDGRIWTSGPLVIPIREAGTPHEISVVWADVNVETRLPCGAVRSVQAGEAVTVYAQASPVIVVGHPPHGLPPITVGESVRVTVPAGGVGARG